MGAWRLIILLAVAALLCASNLADLSHVTPSDNFGRMAAAEDSQITWAVHRDVGHRDETSSFRLAAALPTDSATIVLPWRANAFARQFTPLSSLPALSLQSQQVRWQV